MSIMVIMERILSLGGQYNCERNGKMNKAKYHDVNVDYVTVSYMLNLTVCPLPDSHNTINVLKTIYNFCPLKDICNHLTRMYICGWVGTFVRMCVSNFLFTLGPLPRMKSSRV